MTEKQHATGNCEPQRHFFTLKDFFSIKKRFASQHHKSRAQNAFGSAKKKHTKQFRSCHQHISPTSAAFSLFNFPRNCGFSRHKRCTEMEINLT
jgi:hypothetical protein